MGGVEGKCPLLLFCVFVEFLLGIKMKMLDTYTLKSVGGGILEPGGGGGGGGGAVGGDLFSFLALFLFFTSSLCPCPVSVGHQNENVG